MHNQGLMLPEIKTSIIHLDLNSFKEVKEVKSTLNLGPHFYFLVNEKSVQKVLELVGKSTRLHLGPLVGNCLNIVKTSQGVLVTFSLFLLHLNF